MSIILGVNGYELVEKVLNDLKIEEVNKVNIKRRGNNTISRTEAVKKILASRGKFFTVTFVTKDGTERTINCNVKTDCITELGYVSVYSPKDKGYRNVNPRKIKKLAIGGEQYKVA